ncbi:MAG: alanine--tRNA ligase [Bacillota bacterium]|nr:alanine--tRNA ligase [Bacillota bacterium]
MQRWSADELRSQFLRFFEEKGHKRLPSASLIPYGDPTLLLTAAGMVPFKPYFLGLRKPEYTRVTTCQRCVRTPDIDRVGYTHRHNTFFEMLGNFSFGDYFKREAISWAWEFVTERMQIPKDVLWVSVYEQDDEAARLWQEIAGMPEERIVRLGKSENFWEIGVGPCGPCSEIYVDRGPQYGCADPNCKPGCDNCQRYLEIWNLVFIEFHKEEDGSYTRLEKPGIDTGMGLERAAAVLQGVESNFDIDLVRPIVEAVAERAGVKYGEDPKKDVSLRVITDHMRAVTFLVFDGVVPGNEGRGYVLRRLLRRASRHARQLGIEEPILADISDVVIRQMSVGYPELPERREYVHNMIALEERRFRETLDQGMNVLDELFGELAARGETVLKGRDVFRLYDTYGIPKELVQEIAAERGFTVDLEGFEAALAEQRERARAARGGGSYLGVEPEVWAQVEVPPTRFVGYTTLSWEARVQALLVGGEMVGEARQGQDALVILDATPFYAEAGGQVGDTGTITAPGGQLLVKDVQKNDSGVYVHFAKITSGRIRVGDVVLATVDEKTRVATMRHHTATHLLHAALQEVLGEHALQAGSLVAPDRLRFDFTHFEPLTPEQLATIERIVNEKIMAALPVTWEEMPLEQARRLGAKALFGEKYGEIVRVVRIGDYSLELCGGTHMNNSGEIGPFKIVSEGSVAAGVRRIEALAGEPAWRYIAERDELVRAVARRLQVAPAQVEEKLESVLLQLRQTERERDELRRQLAALQAERLLAQAERVDGVAILTAAVDGVDGDELLAMGDTLRDRLGEGVVVLGTASGGKALFVAMVTPGLVQLGVHAGHIVREAATVAEGGGGGQPHMARAGGKNPAKLADALARAKAVAREQVAAARASR